MNKKQALKEAAKRWGENAAVQDQPRFASTPERRQAAHDALVELRSFTTNDNRKAFKPLRDRLFSDAYSFRFSVGHVQMGLFFGVEGTGDTWEQAFAAADERRRIMYGKAA